MSVVSFNS